MGAQTVQQVVDVLQTAGISMALTPELALKITPASFLTPELRDLIRASKEMLIAWLQHEAANDLAAQQNAKVPARREATPADPDRWCWPRSPAMNGEEIDTLAARLTLFTDKGMGVQAAERLADKLVIRDRQQDGRRLCLECTRLTGHAAASWVCTDWQRARIAIRSKDAQLPGELVRQLQRCDGFTLNSPSP